MSLGLGKQYFVHVIKHIYGDLDTCLKFMQINPPSSKFQWYELRPVPHVKKGSTWCDEYSCDLVEEAL